MDVSWKDESPKVAFDAGTARTLGQYELLLPIGTGGMATVWTARRKGTHGFQKIVAVKVMHDRLRQSAAHERMFLDEATLAARIKHPNVVEIYDLGDQDGVLYQVMEWVDGEPLSALLKACQGKLPIPIAVEIGIQVAAGLHAAHQLRDEDNNPLGLVHRDVSPQNILVGFDGTVKLVDFGVAKATSNTDKTAAGQIKGKMAYMSPEQVSGQPIDRRTDIFVLGVVLYLMTTGRHPFRGENEIATARRIMDGSPPVAPENLDPRYPIALSEIVLQALNRDPFERCSSMADLMRALEAALPPEERISREELGAFMRSRLGQTRERRRNAIREALRGHGDLAPRSSAPSLLSSSLPQQDQPSGTGRTPSSPTMVLSTTALGLPAARRRAAFTVLLAVTTGILGGALGYLGSRSAANAAGAHAPAPAREVAEPTALPCAAQIAGTLEAAPDAAAQDGDGGAPP